MIAVQYVGKKPFACDNVAGSGKFWHGNGDVQDVTEAQAKVLLKFPDQWALADEANREAVEAPRTIQVDDGQGGTIEVPEEALSKPLEKMDKTELTAYAQAKFGKKLDQRQSTKGMLDQVNAWTVDLGD